MSFPILGLQGVSRFVPEALTAPVWPATRVVPRATAAGHAPVGHHGTGARTEPSSVVRSLTPRHVVSSLAVLVDPLHDGHENGVRERSRRRDGRDD